MADPCKLWVGGLLGEFFRDAIVEQLNRLVVDKLPESQRVGIEVRARTFSKGGAVVCPSADIARELFRVCEASPLVFVDEDGTRHPLRARRERTSQQSVCCRVLGTLYGLVETHLKTAGHWREGDRLRVDLVRGILFFVHADRGVLLAEAGHRMVNGELALWIKVDLPNATRFGYEGSVEAWEAAPTRPTA